MAAPPPLVDIGINLTHADFDADRALVIARARAAGVCHLVVTGSSVAGSAAAARLAAGEPTSLSATAGVHPHHAAELDAPGLAALARLLARREVVAVGECGLDYFRDLAPRAVQRAAFARQLELALVTGKPLFLHQRDAHADFRDLVRDAGPGRPPAVVHCFTGATAEAEEYLAMGLHIGITGWICDERRGHHLEATVRVIPAGRLMIETDAPYLLPRTLRPRPRSRRNEPCHLVAVAAAVAAARGESLAALAAHTSATASAFFGLGDRLLPAST
jgi:TatD DNase family protein